MPRGRQFRGASQARGALPGIVVPDKLYFRIGEVSEMAQTKPYVLRYWETEFPTLKPRKSASGQRLYRRHDVETVFEIKRLLYERGFTIAGARRQLASGSKEAMEQAPLFRSTADGAQLKAIRRELESVLTILSRKC